MEDATIEKTKPVVAGNANEDAAGQPQGAGFEQEVTNKVGLTAEEKQKLINDRLAEIEKNAGNTEATVATVPPAKQTPKMNIFTKTWNKLKGGAEKAVNDDLSKTTLAEDIDSITKFSGFSDDRSNASGMTKLALFEPIAAKYNLGESGKQLATELVMIQRNLATINPGKEAVELTRSRNEKLQEFVGMLHDSQDQKAA